MTRKLLLFFALVFTGLRLFSQRTTDSLLALGDKYYKKHEYATAAPLWQQAAALASNRLAQGTYYYYTANAYASAKDSTNSFKCLDIAIRQLGYNDVQALTSDDAFNFMHDDKRWKKLIGSIRPVYTTAPRKVKVVDTDVRNFWEAYDAAQKDTANAAALYKKLYIDKGSAALQFYYANKINNMRSFMYMHNRRRKYYASIRANTLQAGQLKKRYISSFVAFKKLYPQAIFPPVYFVVGKLNSAGTVCREGLILGIDQACMSPTADTTELTGWEKHNISLFAELPYTVAHELIHYEQGSMAGDTSLLQAAIREGMADFIGELISGKTSNERLHVYAKGKEQQIWSDFKKEMYLERANNWIANSEQETPDKPADLGYWVGYQICKAYYEEATSKQQAIYDMLHIQDYKKFLTLSKADEKLSNTMAH